MAYYAGNIATYDKNKYTSYDDDKNEILVSFTMIESLNKATRMIQNGINKQLVRWYLSMEAE